MSDTATTDVTLSGDQLKSIIERVEQLEEEKAERASDIKDVYAEAKGNGFDVGTIKRIIKERKADKDRLAEEEELLDLYKRAIGMA